MEAINSNLKVKLPTPSDSKTFTEYVQKLHKYIMSFSNYPNLIGFSMGGRIAFYLKCLYPESYDKVMTISSQIICQENKQERQKTDQNRLTDINTESEFKNFLIKFFKLGIYGDFFATKMQQKNSKY